MASSDLPISGPLTESELGDAETLVREAGWNQLAADWRIFLQHGTVYAVRDGMRVVATAATLPYDGGFGWVSMVLVAGAYRRQGIAKRLLARCIDDLVAAGIVPVLDATPAGQPLYRSLGFAEAWVFQRYAGHGLAETLTPPGGTIIRPIVGTDGTAVQAYDRAAFGADRSGVLANLRERVPQAALIAERGGRICGYLMGRDGRRATQLGPLIADDADTALALLARGLAAVQGPVYIDLADSKASLRAWLTARGFTSERPLTRMLLRHAKSFDDVTKTFAVAGPELG